MTSIFKFYMKEHGVFKTSKRAVYLDFSYEGWTAVNVFALQKDIITLGERLHSKQQHSMSEGRTWFFGEDICPWKTKQIRFILIRILVTKLCSIQFYVVAV